MEKDGEEITLDQGLQIVRNVKGDFNKYDELMIVNPTNKKFEDTVLNKYYYDLLRIYSNELEKENSILFVMGFSFADQHIRSLTMQVANSNPTLIIYIFCYESTSNDIYENDIKSNAKNKNIEILYPSDDEKYDLSTITKCFLIKYI